MMTAAATSAGPTYHVPFNRDNVMHLHGTGRRKGGGSIGVGLLAAAAVVIVTIAGIVQVGWAALAPFGSAALILGILLWIMRATDRAAK